MTHYPSNLRTVAIADSSPIYLEGIACQLTTWGFTVVARDLNSRKLRDQLRQLAEQPNLCLLDLETEQLEAMSCTIAIRGLWPEIHIVFMAYRYSFELKKAVLEYAAACLLKGFGEPQWKHTLDALTQLMSNIAKRSIDIDYR